MLDHYIQKDIVYRLAFSPRLRFSELKPDNLDSKLFTYHLKKVVNAGYVKKTEEGLYELTPDGRRLGIHVLDNQKSFINQADSILILVIRRKSDGAWLLYKRKTHPLLGRKGFMHVEPLVTVDVLSAAKLECKQKTGLDCEFRALGSGYFRVYEKENLESFVHFDMLVCDDAQGGLSQDDSYAEYSWITNPDFTDENMLPNMSTLAELYRENRPFFIEKTFNT